MAGDDEHQNGDNDGSFSLERKLNIGSYRPATPDGATAVGLLLGGDDAGDDDESSSDEEAADEESDQGRAAHPPPASPPVPDDVQNSGDGPPPSRSRDAETSGCFEPLVVGDPVLVDEDEDEDDDAETSRCFEPLVVGAPPPVLVDKKDDDEVPPEATTALTEADCSGDMANTTYTDSHLDDDTAYFDDYLFPRADHSKGRLSSRRAAMLLVLSGCVLVAVVIAVAVEASKRDGRTTANAAGAKSAETNADGASSEVPSFAPSGRPSARPSSPPSVRPSPNPSARPSSFPSRRPSALPSARPSSFPSDRPSSFPSVPPSAFPSRPPTEAPSAVPSSAPSSSAPSAPPSSAPSSARPSPEPSSPRPSLGPFADPSASPSSTPSAPPSRRSPSAVPSDAPSSSPPSASPSSLPSVPPTEYRPKPYLPGHLNVVQNGLLLSEGLSAKIIAKSGRRVRYKNGNGKSIDDFHADPDAGGTFAIPDDDPVNPGGWVYVGGGSSGTEAEGDGGGGVGVLAFNRRGEVVDYEMIPTNVTAIGGGGKTPWNTWISFESASGNGDDGGDDGRVWEIDPFGKEAARITALGGGGGGDGNNNYRSFAHYVRNRNRPRFYVAENEADGALRRFTPDEPDWSDPSRTLRGAGTTRYLILEPSLPRNDTGTYRWTKILGAARRSAEDHYPFAGGVDVVENKLFLVSESRREMFVLDLDGNAYERTSTRGGLFDGRPDAVRSVLPGEGGGEDEILYFAEEGAGVRGRDADGRFFDILEARDFRDDATSVDFGPDMSRLYVSYRRNGLLFEVTRDDGEAFRGLALSIKSPSGRRGA